MGHTCPIISQNTYSSGICQGVELQIFLWPVPIRWSVVKMTFTECSLKNLAFNLLARLSVKLKNQIMWLFNFIAVFYLTSLGHYIFSICWRTLQGRAHGTPHFISCTTIIDEEYFITTHERSLFRLSYKNIQASSNVLSFFKKKKRLFILREWEIES